MLDRFGPVPQGVHSGIATTLLPVTQLAWGVNVTCRGGYAHNRPPLRKLALTYKGDDEAEVQALATEARFQGAAYYSSYGNNPSCIIASIGGRIFRYTIWNNNCAVDDLTPAGDPNNSTLEQAWLAQGQDFLVINDGESRPLSFNGATVTRLPVGTWLPVGKQIHYVNGRFIVALPDGRSYIAGDLVYSRVSGTPAYNFRDSILRTTENASILAGQPFAIPLDAGAITSLFSVAIPDTSLGQGPLQVGTTGGVFSVDLPLDATLWTTTQQPSQVVSLPNGGPTGFYSTVTVNGDAWYRGGDGLRSFVTARRDFNTWVQTPLSQELARVLPYDTPQLLQWSSALNFGNRLLCTCSPYKVSDRGIVHRGLVALDFNNISSITARSQPAYDGVWTGLPILQLVKGKFNGVERCFAFALDSDNAITLYELGVDGSSRFDWDGEQQVPMECWLESPALLGREGDPRVNVLKRIVAGDLFLSQLSGTGDGDVTVTVQYRPDYYPCYVDWGDEFTMCAPACAQPTNCTQPSTTQPQYATNLRLPQPADDCNEVAMRPFRTGYFFQVKVAWTGHLALHSFSLWATPQPENLDSRTCETAPACAVLQCCTDNLFTYLIETEPTPPPPEPGGILEWDTDNDAPTWDTDEGSTIHPDDLT
jgi:hypothetical protein